MMKSLDRTAKICLVFLLFVILVGILAPWLAPNLPNQADIINKFAEPSFRYPLGTDHLGRCIFSRIIYGIRPTIILSLLTMAATIFIGSTIGLVSGYFKGFCDEVFMRLCDIMLSFPSQVMILAIVGMLGPGLTNVVIASIAIKWAWYARMIRGCVVKHTEKNYLTFARVSGCSSWYIIAKHLLPVVAVEIVILASLDTGWVILNISTLSFLGLGVQAPTAEWGAMLTDAKAIISTRPYQMIIPGFAILIVVGAFNLLGDSLRDALAVKERSGDSNS